MYAVSMAATIADTGWCHPNKYVINKGPFGNTMFPNHNLP